MPEGTLGTTKQRQDHAVYAGMIESTDESVGRVLDTLFWHFPHYHGSGNRPTGAIRAGDFKLIEWFEDNHVELYNLHDDLGETTDLSAEMPEKADELRAALHAWRRAVDARMPTPNPEWEADDDDR